MLIRNLRVYQSGTNYLYIKIKRIKGINQCNYQFKLSSKTTKPQLNMCQREEKKRLGLDNVDSLMVGMDCKTIMFVL